MRCRICENENEGTYYQAREMFIGLRDTFQYWECDVCSCVQLVDIPDDMSSYYSAEYYTAETPQIFDFSQLDHSNEEEYVRQGLHFSALRYLQNVITSLDCSFLDVGCGSAHTVRNLAAMGMKKTTGIDLYLHPKHAYESENCRVFQSDIFQLDEKFDVILLCHSLEHMEDHKEVLLKVRDLLKDDGLCVIRIPIASYAWNIYRTDWVQLDPPRHLILHSFRSLEYIFKQAKLNLVNYFTDSSTFQFVSSELYKRDIPLVTQRKMGKMELTNYFTAEQIEYFKEMTQKLNEECLGDQIILYLGKG